MNGNVHLYNALIQGETSQQLLDGGYFGLDIHGPLTLNPNDFI